MVVGLIEKKRKEKMIKGEKEKLLVKASHCYVRENGSQQEKNRLLRAGLSPA